MQCIFITIDIMLFFYDDAIILHPRKHQMSDYIFLWQVGQVKMYWQGTMACDLTGVFYIRLQYLGCSPWRLCIYQYVWVCLMDQFQPKYCNNITVHAMTQKDSNIEKKQIILTMEYIVFVYSPSRIWMFWSIILPATLYYEGKLLFW